MWRRWRVKNVCRTTTYNTYNGFEFILLQCYWSRFHRMVVLREQKSMFWGVTLDSGKRYNQTVERGFHISMAALEVKPAKDESKKGHVSVMIAHEKAEFVLCTLNYSTCMQQPLDLNFIEGEEVTFFLNGAGHVHLSGWVSGYIPHIWLLFSFTCMV